MSTTDLLGVLRRWEDTGGTWRVVDRTPEQVTVALCTCDFGEEMQRIVDRSGVLSTHLAGRGRSDEPPIR